MKICKIMLCIVKAKYMAVVFKSLILKLKFIVFNCSMDFHGFFLIHLSSLYVCIAVALCKQLHTNWITLGNVF